MTELEERVHKAISSYDGHVTNGNHAEVMKIVVQAQIDVLQRVNAAAEADMLSGNPVTGAHHRAIDRELAALRNR